MSFFYKKLYTPLKETLEDDFCDLNPSLIKGGASNVGLKFIHVLRTENGLKLKTITKRDPNTNLTTTVESEFKIPKYNVTLEGKFGTDRKFQDTISLVDVFGQKGSKVFVRGLLEDGKTKGEVGFEFKNGTVALDGTVTKPSEGKFKGLGSVVYKHNIHSLGGDVEFEQDTGVTRYSGKLQIDRSESTFCLFFNDVRVPKKGSDPKREVGFGYFNKLRPDLSGALDFKVDSKDFDSELRVGSDLKVDQSTNFKSRLLVKRRELRIGLAYKQKLTPTTKVILSTDLESRSFFGSSLAGDHRFNFTFSYGDD